MEREEAMAILYFSDVLRKVGLDPAKVKLIRHSLADKEFQSCYAQDMVLEYTKRQKPGFSKGFDYWCVFISEKGTLAKLFACYKVGKSVPDTHDLAPIDFPYPEWFQGEAAYFDLEPLDILKEYENRLIIDWGKSTLMWHQKGTTEKPIVEIQAAKIEPFPGFERLVLTYDALKEVVDDQTTAYEDWRTSLKSVNAIYLIVDSETGKQYVGSAYGKDGLLGRWAYYISSQHGDNKQMKELICAHPERYHHFQFSILQILPKTVTDEEVIRIESLYKDKLLSKRFGMNDN